MIRRTLVGVVVAVTLTALPGGAAAAAPRTTLAAVEHDVMCTVCGVPLELAESAQADRERAFIRSLIDRGQTKAQVERALVTQYGRAVLALPRHSGFSLAAYLVPIALALAVGLALSLTLPRWRRRPAEATAVAAAPSPADAAWLDDELARLDA